MASSQCIILQVVNGSQISCLHFDGLALLDFSPKLEHLTWQGQDVNINAIEKVGKLQQLTNLTLSADYTFSPPLETPLYDHFCNLTRLVSVNINGYYDPGQGILNPFVTLSRCLSESSLLASPLSRSFSRLPFPSFMLRIERLGSKTCFYVHAGNHTGSCRHGECVRIALRTFALAASDYSSRYLDLGTKLLLK